jgi:hypothetical protein
VVQDSNGKYHLSIEFAKYVAYDMAIYSMLATIPTNNPEENLVPSQLQLVREWLDLSNGVPPDNYYREGYITRRGSTDIDTHKPILSFAIIDPSGPTLGLRFADTTNSYFQLR